MTSEPIDIVRFGTRRNFLQQLDRVRFVAWLRRVLNGIDELYRHVDDKPVRLDKTMARDAAAGNSHSSLFVQVMHSHQLRNSSLPE